MQASHLLFSALHVLTLLRSIFDFLHYFINITSKSHNKLWLSFLFLHMFCFPWIFSFPEFRSISITNPSGLIFSSIMDTVSTYCLYLKILGYIKSFINFIFLKKCLMKSGCPLCLVHSYHPGIPPFSLQRSCFCSPYCFLSWLTYLGVHNFNCF